MLITPPAFQDYDLFGAVEAGAPGVVMQREIIDAASVVFEAGGRVPLTQAQILSVAGPLPPYPAPLPRFADCNPDIDGWALDTPGPLVGYVA